MTEVVIRLERPATVTPELRAWISHRLGARRARLSRTRSDGSASSTLLLRIRTDSKPERNLDEEVGDLLTDLRLLGLNPTLLADEMVAETASDPPAAGR